MDLITSAEQRTMTEIAGKLVETWLAGDLPVEERWAAVSEIGLDSAILSEDHDGLGLGLADLLGPLRALGPVAHDFPWASALVAGPLFAVAGGAEHALGSSIGIAVEQRARFADRVEFIAAVSGDGVCITESADWRQLPLTDLLGRSSWFTGPQATPLTVEPDAVRHAVAAGRVAEASILLGVADRAIALAVDYAQLRTQFGRPIGQFQAVKHLLADARTELAFTESIVLGAALTVDQGGPLADRDSAIALLGAVETAELAARTSIQVHGAIGYTAELPLGRLLSAARHGADSWGGRGALARLVEDSLFERDGHLGDGSQGPARVVDMAMPSSESVARPN